MAEYGPANLSKWVQAFRQKMVGVDDIKLETGVFLSWSGAASHDVAVELKKWLRFIIQAAQPWMSDEDISPGSNWFGAISDRITKSKIGIICVTRENQYSPWLLWEAGALYAGFRDSQLVVPLLINLDVSELVSPLQHFQVVDARNKDEMHRLLAGISKLLPESIRPTSEMISVQMEHLWDDFQASISKAVEAHSDSALPTIVGGQTFGDGAQLYLAEHKDGNNASYVRNMHALRRIGPYLNHLPISEVTNKALAQFKKDRSEGRLPNGEKIKPAMIGTINKELTTVSAILHRAVSDWGWMQYAPTIRKISGETKKQYPLNWDEQDRILVHLPEYMHDPVVFALNTGLRRNEIKSLTWNQMESLGVNGVNYFRIPIGSKYRKVVVLNSVAQKIIDDLERAKLNEEFVFTKPNGAPLSSFGSKIWLQAWKKAGLPSDKMTLKGVENLRHTFALRLRHANISQDDIDMLLGSTKTHILTRYAQPDISHLLRLVEKITVRQDEPFVRH